MTQVFRVEISTVIEIYADSIEDAIEAISIGEINLPSTADGPDNVWAIEHISLQNEAFLPA